MKQTAAIVEFGTSKIVCAIGESKNIDAFDVTGLGICSYAGLNHKQWRQPHLLESALSKAIADAEDQAGRKVKQVYVNVPGPFVDVTLNAAKKEIENKDRRVTVDDVEDLIKEAERIFVPERMEIIHRCPVWFSGDNNRRDIDPVGMRTLQLTGNVSFVMAEKSYMRDMAQLFEKLGIEILMFIATPLSECLMIIPTEDRDNLAIMVDVGYYSTDVSAVQGDGIIRYKSFDVGGAHFAADISQILGITPMEAEQLKRRYVFGLETSSINGYEVVKSHDGRAKMYPHATVQQVMDARMEELSLIIDGIISKWSLSLTSQTKLYLTGGGIAMMRGAKEVLENIVNLQVRTPKIVTPKINAPNYYSVLGMMDFAFNGVGDGGPAGEGGSKIVNKLINFFTN
ncbi:MAG: cell division FtsA domain-containing protein [Christensenellales bacterium]